MASCFTKSEVTLLGNCDIALIRCFSSLKFTDSNEAAVPRVSILRPAPRISDASTSTVQGAVSLELLEDGAVLLEAAPFGAFADGTTDFDDCVAFPATLVF